MGLTPVAFLSRTPNSLVKLLLNSGHAGDSGRLGDSMLGGDRDLAVEGN